MATKRKSTKKSGDALAPEAKAATSKVVAVWEDDPGDPASHPPLIPIQVPVPNQAATPLPFKIAGTTPPAQVFQPGTPNFRFWAAAAGLRRTADFWSKIVPPGTKYEVGNTLPVNLDSGVDLNAFYTRGEGGDSPGLHFFHEAVSGHTFFSGESPDVICHEMGHGILDAIRPQLFDAQTIEAAAFHEGFADCSAMLSALQVLSFRQTVLNETGGKLNRASRLSRLAEQLGAAIRMIQPDAVDSDCLRNAANSFFYHDPQELPTSAPASALSSEPHSFSRVFSGAFLDILAGILLVINSDPTTDDVLQATQDAAKILVGGILAAPVVPDYFSQVAANMITVGAAAPFNGKYTTVIKSSFVRRGILSLQGAATVAEVSAWRRRAALQGGAKQEELHRAAISAVGYGLTKGTLTVHGASQPKRMAVSAASLALGPLQPRAAQSAAESYTEDLFQRGHVDPGKYADPTAGLHHPGGFHTHMVVDEGGELVLKRTKFDCGFRLP
jgi:hypothetical protein